MVEYESERMFELYKYSATHGQLLLCANKTNASSSRIEILFKGVRVVNLPTLLHGVSIVKQDARIYRVSTRDFTGHVDAIAMFVHEDNLDYHEPSALLRGPHV